KVKRCVPCTWYNYPIWTFEDEKIKNQKRRQDEMKKTILVGEFKHETNSFMPEKSGVEAFMARDYFFGEEIFKVFQGVRNELGVILDYFCPIENCRLVPVMAFNAQPGGIVTREVFQSARDALLEA